MGVIDWNSRGFTIVGSVAVAAVKCTCEADEASAIVTGSINRNPRRGWSPQERGLSALSPSACRILLIAVPREVVEIDVRPFPRVPEVPLGLRPALAAARVLREPEMAVPEV
jgi:hypothetical protein